MNITKIENGRAAFAFAKVKQAVHDNNVDQDKLRSFIKKMPTMIQVNGLGQTLAFYYSKRNKEKEHKVVYDMMNEWLVVRNEVQLFEQAHQQIELVENIINLNSREYKIATAETLAILNWMRRFVEGMVETKGKNKNGGE